MSLASLINKNSYIGNGSTPTYNYTFKIFQDSELRVVIKDTLGVETVLTDIDFTVTGAGETAGGTITLIGPRPYLDEMTMNLLSGFQILIKRSVEIKQETDIRNQGDFFPEVHEDVFDRLTMIDQQLQEQLDRTLVMPETTQNFNTTLPTNLEGTPGASFITNATGDGFDVGPTANEIANAQGSAMAAAASAAAALVSEQNADISEDLAMQWAIRTDAPVTPPGAEFSSKEYAIGTQRRGLLGGGSAKDWANYTGGTVDDTEFSAKKYATDAAAAVSDINDLIIELEALTGIQVELGFQRDLGFGNGIQTVFPIGGTYNGMAIFATINGMVMDLSEYTIVGANVSLNFTPDVTQKIGVIGLKSAQGDLFVIESLVGAVDNVNTTFTYTNAAKDVDSFLVYKAGQFLHKFKYSHNLATKTIITDVAPNFGQYMIAVIFVGPTNVKCKQESLGFGTMGGKTRFGPLVKKPFNMQSTWIYVNGIGVEQDNFTLTEDLYIETNFPVSNLQEVEVAHPYVKSDYYVALETRALTAAENASRVIRLKSVPAVIENVKVDHQDASFLVYDVDFTISDDKLTLLPTVRANAIGTGEFLRIEYKV